MADVGVINGILGSGKSTLARRLAEQFDRGAHIEGDRLQEWIVAGGVPPAGQPREEERRQDRPVREEPVPARRLLR